MEGCSQKTKIIRQFILDNVSFHPNDIVKVVAQRFAISRQAAARHLKKLATQGDIETEGNTSGRTYRPSKGRIVEFNYAIDEKLLGQNIWKADIQPLLQTLPDNVVELWKYCFEEICANGINHSGAENISVKIIQQKSQSTISVSDDGEGIFHNIKEKLGLESDEEAALELSSGKWSTISGSLTKPNLFLSSRMADHFTIHSKRVMLVHSQDVAWDWTLDRSEEDISGTLISMIIGNDTQRTVNEISADCGASYQNALAKTCIPIRLVDYSYEALFSRSQARRILARVDKFKIAILDFFGIKEIGPAFADQIFRVFSSEHPEIELLYTNANKEVESIIQEARDQMAGNA